MRLTRHNGRSGKNGTYNPKHNDRRFDVKKSEHIQLERTLDNVYWDCYQGLHSPENHEQEENAFFSFEDIERLFYSDRYSSYCSAQHERNRKNGHPERNRTTDDLRVDKKTCPEETLIQIGTMEQSVPADVLKQVAIEYFEEFERRFGEYVHILDWSLHLDESTPHIHERHVFDCPNRYGEIAPQQEKALESLGIELPHPDQKTGRLNNRKMMFDSACRALLFDIATKHDLHLEQEPEYGGRKYLEKQDYIMMKQRQVIAEKQAAVEAEDARLEDRRERVRWEEELLLKRRAAVQEEETRLEEQKQEAESVSKKLKELESKAFRVEDNLDIKTYRLEVAKERLEEVKKRLQEEEEKLAALEDRISDRESFIEEVTETAYNEAVSAVSEKAIEETRNLFFDKVSEFREDMLINDPHAVKIREYLYEALHPLLEQFRGLTSYITERLRTVFSEPAEKARIKAMMQESLYSHLALGHRGGYTGRRLPTEETESDIVKYRGRSR